MQLIINTLLTFTIALKKFIGVIWFSPFAIIRPKHHLKSVFFRDRFLCEHLMNYYYSYH